ncbi:MAG TPA: acyltransferase [Solirubrobacteraceae bacterium]|nr:acyltransferase [Solirubrobacteraceae bacterium]
MTGTTTNPSSPARRPLPQPVVEPPRRRGRRWILGWLKGWALRPRWRLRELTGGPRIRIGRRFSLQGRLTLRGPGEVVLGDDVVVASHARPWTNTREARIEIGDRSYVNGTGFSCARSIRVGPDAILGDARIYDTDHHPVSRRRTSDRSLEAGVRPVSIAENVWIGSGAAVLKGVSIGANSVVGFGAVVTGDVGADRIAVGNPARDAGPVPD